MKNKNVLSSLLIISLLSFYFVNVQGQIIRSVADGNYNNAGTWQGGVIPSTSDNVQINHTVTVNGVWEVNSIEINSSSTYEAALILDMGANVTVSNDIVVKMGSGIAAPAADITTTNLATGTVLTINGNLKFERESKSTNGCYLEMNGGTVNVGGNLEYFYRAGGYRFWDGSQWVNIPEAIAEIDLYGDSQLNVADTMRMTQEEAITIETFQNILQVRTQDNAIISAGTFIGEQLTDVTIYTPQLDIGIFGDSQFTLSGDLILDQIGLDADYLRFQSANKGTFDIGGNFIMDKQAGRTMVMELYADSKGTIAGDVSISKDGGTSNIALRINNQSTLTVNGTTGISELATAGASTFEMEILNSSKLSIPNGGLSLKSTDDGVSNKGGSTHLTVNGTLEVGKDLSLNSTNNWLKLVVSGATSSVSVGGDFTYDMTNDVVSTSGIFITDGNLSVGQDFIITQWCLVNSKKLNVAMDGAFDATIGGNFTWDDKKGNAYLLVGASVANSSGKLKVLGNMNLTNSATSSSSGMITELHGTSQIIVSGNATFALTSAFATSIDENAIRLYNSSNLSTRGDLVLNSRYIQNLTLYLYDDSWLALGAALSRPGAYSNIAFNNQSYLLLDGSSPQVIPEEVVSGAGTDKIVYNKVVVDNSSGTIPQFTLISDVTLNQLEFIKGIIETSSTKKIIFRDNGSSTGASDNGFIDGPIQKLGTSGPFEFPTGDNNGTVARWAPVSIDNITGGTSALVTTAEYFLGTPPNNTNLDEAALAHISGIEFWDVSPSESIFSNVSLYWKDAGFSEITDASDLAFAHYDGTWVDESGSVGSGSTVGEGGIGYITASLTSYSPMSFGSKGGVNPLPIVLTDLNAELKEKFIEISWSTSSEVNNDHFEVEKSMDGKDFQKITEVKGAGTTSEPQSYQIKDRAQNGINYYRLKQVDLDGTFTFSKVISVEKRDLIVSAPVVYPNPMNSSPGGNLTIDLNPDIAHSGDALNVSVIGPTGNLVMKKDIIYNGGSINLDLQRELNKGIHFIIVSNYQKRFQTKLLVE